jgi:hypothetical protein
MKSFDEMDKIKTDEELIIEQYRALISNYEANILILSRTIYNIQKEISNKTNTRGQISKKCDILIDRAISAITLNNVDGGKC